MNIDLLFTSFELIGIVAFAISGVIIGIEENLDAFGAVVLGITCSVGGGMIRDVIMGNIPPSMFIKPIYVIAAFVVSILVFMVEYITKKKGKAIKSFPGLINISDALGLGVFVVVGVDFAIRDGYFSNSFLCIFLGTITGVGGGMLRDIFAMKVPMILRKKIYALAAIGGATLYYFLISINIYRTIATLISVFTVVTIRVCAAHYKWNLPTIDG